MALGLRNTGEPISFVSEPLRVSPLTWWFWVKAGIGFSVGVVITFTVAWIFYMRFILPAVLRALFR